MHVLPDATASTGHVMSGLAGGSAAAATLARSRTAAPMVIPTNACLIVVLL
jgi:hypothetical protein